MGALLSLPLLALPSMGTVSPIHIPAPWHGKALTNPPALHIRGKLLRCGYLLSSLQRLR
jgi:hypothetical protein